MRKMNTATMTWLHNGNYGTLLQAYALQQTIWDLGYDNIIIDYAPGRIMKAVNLFTSGNSPRLFIAKFKAWLTERQKRRLESTKAARGGEI